MKTKMQEARRRANARRRVRLILADWDRQIKIGHADKRLLADFRAVTVVLELSQLNVVR